MAVIPDHTEVIHMVHGHTVMTHDYMVTIHMIHCHIASLQIMIIEYII